MSTAFSYSEYSHLIQQFAQNVPDLLSKHSSTSDLGRKIEFMNITQIMDTRFTVAIVGQMRSGKSTLLNSLIESQLAPVGVNETTATINCFRYGSKELSSQFRVNWKDGSSEMRERQDIGMWLGKHENAQNTLSLDFFAERDYLKKVSLVDTPGTRSVLSSHESATKNFILEDAMRHEKNSLQQASRADAVIYVINPVAKAKDSELLDMFGSNTRLPGSSPYNSLAVVQKWELPGMEGDFVDEINPIAWVQKKCERLKKQLEGKVSHVMYVSGWLATVVYQYKINLFNDLLKIYSLLDLDNLYDGGEDIFKEEFLKSDVAMKVERRAIYEKIGYPMLKMLFWIIHHYKPQNGEALRQKISSLSNIGQLHQILEKKFLAQASLIKASTVLRKAWEPCSIGIARLKKLEEEHQQSYRLGQECILDAEKLSSEKLQRYIRSSLSAVREDLSHIRKIRTELEKIRDVAYENFNLLDEDLNCQEALEGEAGEEISDQEKQGLRILFGIQGTEMHKRLSCEESTSKEVQIEAALELLDLWEARAKRGSALRRIAEHACALLNHILNILES